MEVIKEKDLTQSTSASWVRAIDSAGNPIKINANDLMALMSEATASSKGLMSASGFMDRGTIYDANLCIENGTYYCPDNTVNAPTTYRYVLIAFKHKVGSIIQYRSEERRVGKECVSTSGCGMSGEV